MTRSSVWGGRTAEERSAERRAAMIDRAIEIWSAEGWAAVSMRRICADVGLNDRYFTSEFGDREGLLVAAWESAKQEVLAVFLDAIARFGPESAVGDRIESIVTALTEWLTVETAKATILLNSSAGSAALEAQRRAAFQQIVRVMIQSVQPYLKAEIDPEHVKIDVVIAVGGILELLRAWQSAYIDVDASHIVKRSTDLLLRLGQTDPARQ